MLKPYIIPPLDSTGLQKFPQVKFVRKDVRPHRVMQ